MRGTYFNHIFIGSTSRLLSFVQDDSANQLCCHRNWNYSQMKKAAPQKEFIPAPPEDDTCSCNECPYMKLNTLEKLYLCMKNKYPEINMDEEIRKRALLPIEKMLAMS
jgi:quinolinate synthase